MKLVAVLNWQRGRCETGERGSVRRDLRRSLCAAARRGVALTMSKKSPTFEAVSYTHLTLPTKRIV